MKLDVYKKHEKKWQFILGACPESSIHKLKENPNDKIKGYFDYINAFKNTLHI